MAVTLAASQCGKRKYTLWAHSVTYVIFFVLNFFNALAVVIRNNLSFFPSYCVFSLVKQTITLDVQSGRFTTVEIVFLIIKRLNLDGAMFYHGGNVTILYFYDPIVMSHYYVSFHSRALFYSKKS